MLVGRESEIAALDRLLEAAREGRSGALLLRGEAGIGKTALLAHAEAAARDFRVLRATGIQAEGELPFATLHQLLRTLQDRIDALAAPQARAVCGALGLSDEREVDRFLVGAGTLTLLADAAEDRPLLALLDDAAWFDRPSGDALAFVARRLHAEGVVLLFAARDEPGQTFELPGVDELVVGRLDEADARRLLGAGLDTSRRDDVLARAAGNPLALLELARQPADGSGTAGGAEQAYARRVAALPEPTQALLLLAAAESSDSLTTISAAARELGLDVADFEPAELAGLVLIADGVIEFRHPLVRSATYRAAPFGRRARAHRALAAALTGDEDADRRAWHRAAAVVGTDEQAAGDLERTADRALARGGPAAAAAALARSAELTADPEPRARRLTAAADAAWLAGDADRALALLERVDTEDDAVRVTADYVHGLVAGQQGSSTEAIEWFLRAARAGSHAAPKLALQAVSRAAMAAWESGRTESVIELRDVAASIPVATPDEQSAAAFVEALTSFSDHDYDRAVPAFARAAETGADSSDVSTLLMASWAYAFLGRQDEGLVVARRGERIARSSGAVAALASLLGPIAGWSVGTSQFAAAEAAAAEGLELARETGQTAQAAHCMAFLAYVAGIRGREEACRAYARETIELARAHELLLAGSTAEASLGFLDLGAGRYEDALTRFRTQQATGHATARFAFVDELMEAAARAGRPDEALAPLAAWERFIGGRGMLLGDLVLARGRAMLARPEDADEAFQAVLEMDAGGRWPFYQARTELAYGEFLRRARRKTEARIQLRAAYEGFQRLGAEVWADRAAAELRATGETARKRDTSTIDDLTPQELQIAKLVAEGGRNREIAGQLFLSPKTVEYHLRKVFQKLGITSRTELVKLVAGGRELVGTP